MPTLTLVATDFAPGRTNGPETAAQIRAAIASTSASSLMSSQRTTNSSPDMRASVSPERSARGQPLGDGHQQRVADAWP